MSGSPGSIFALVRDGLAHSRADLARITGLAPSTIALRVEALIGAGYLEEAGQGRSSGGRRPRQLRVADRGRIIGAIDLGVTHVTLGLYDLSGERLAETHLPLDFQGTPHDVLTRVDGNLRDLIAGLDGAPRLVGIGLAIPGPVSHPSGRVVSPSRMPGWNGADVGAILGEISGVPVHAENDANAMAWGEYMSGGRESPDLILVKAGSSIGTGVIADGRLFRGARGLAGDISHTAVPDAPQILCTCGRFGCLDIVAGGAAMVQALRATGVDIDDVGQLAALGADGHPLATRLLRESGLRIGTLLATLVSFFNPSRLVLAGPLAEAEAFVAGARSSIYGACLPMSTAGLTLAESTGGIGLGAQGAAELIIDQLFTVEAVNAAMGAA